MAKLPDSLLSAIFELLQ
jgi:hypothetical protein